MFKKKDKTYHSYWSISWNIFKKNKVAMACLGIVIILCLVALFAPWIAPYEMCIRDRHWVEALVLLW